MSVSVSQPWVWGAGVGAGVPQQGPAHWLEGSVIQGSSQPLATGQEHHLQPRCHRFAAATAHSGRFDTSLANSFSSRLTNFQSAVPRFPLTTATNQMLDWIQDMKGNRQTYGLIAEWKEG